MINKSKLDEAFNAEIVRVSTLEYNAQAICTHFYAKLCERLATVDAPADTTTASIEPAAEVHQSIDALEAAQNAAYPIPDSPHQSVVQRAVDDREAYRRGWMDHLNASKDVASRGAAQGRITSEENVPVGHVVTWNKGGSGEHNSIEPIGKSGYSLAAQLPEGTLIYTSPLATRTAGSATPVAQEPLPTEISERLRERATGGYTAVRTEDGALMLKAADEIERYYGGMVAWKRTAEKKDRSAQATQAERSENK